MTPLALRRDDAGAATIVGELLLIAILVVTMGALALAAWPDGPPADGHANVGLRVLCGADGAWGSGDERIVATHEGGSALRAAGGNWTVSVGGVETQLAAPGDGVLAVGERWEHRTEVAAGADVAWRMAVDLGPATQVVGWSGVARGCGP